MINLTLGQPGGGKSYEAVAFHIIPAIVRGRKVITNLSLNVDVFEQYFPGARQLIEIRGAVFTESGLVRPFSLASHYGDTWKHPEDGVGPLYVIDECHLALPLRGTPVGVEEWYSLHRHELADVLLITQSYGKINKAIRDLVQLVYRCKKATAFGSSDRYIRKVQDGLRGEVVNTSIRKYESKYFPLYKSHTLSGAAATEYSASDVVPHWKRWPFKGAVLMMILAACVIVHQLTKSKPVPKQPVATVSAPVAAPFVQEQIKPVEPPKPAPESRGPDKKMHPYDGQPLHLVATLVGKRPNASGELEQWVGGYVSLGDGVQVKTISFDDLRQTGYDITYLSPTVVSLMYKGYDVGYVVADVPRQSMTIPSGIATAAK
jgi:zona occludens toxin